MRLAAGIEYAGSNYAGWQKQQEVITIQQLIEEALSFVAGSKVITTCAGRTDSGVHACNQVIHFDTTAKREDYSWILGVNTYLKHHSIRLLWIKEVSQEFSARYSAQARTYQYLVYNEINSPALLRGNITWYAKNLDLEKIHNALEYFVGEHDFSSFRASKCQAKTPIRTIEKFTVTKKDKIIVFEIKANAFLYHMVRNIMGLILEIGSNNKLSIDYVTEVLALKNREKSPDMAPADGLYFISAHYPAEYNIPLYTKPWFLA